jgi:hypothetical protein
MKTNIRVNVGEKQVTDAQKIKQLESELSRRWHDIRSLEARLSLARAIIDSGDTLIEAYRRDSVRKLEKIRTLQRIAVALLGIIVISGVAAIIAAPYLIK